MAQQINADLTSADAQVKGLDGGLNVKADPTRLAPPITTRSDNAMYTPVGSVPQLPAFASMGMGAAKHVYNLHERDCNQPSASGDVMVHGEYPDGANGYTVPTWAHNFGASPSINQPTLPFTARTKVLAGRLGGPLQTQNSYQLEAQSLQFAKQEVVPSGSKRRYAMGFGNNSTFRFVVGNVDGLTESAFVTQYIGPSGQQAGGNYPCDMAGIQNSSNWCAITLALSGGVYTLVVSTLDFNGNVVANTTLPGVMSQLDDGAPAYQIVQHAGRTYVAYFLTSDKYLRFFDILSGNTYTTIVGGGSVTGAFALFSPYSHTVKSGEFLGVIKNNSAYMLYRANSTSNFTIVMGPQTLPNASVQPSGASPLAATGTLIVTDANGGVGANASFLMTVFRNYPEVYPGNAALGEVFYNSIAVDQISYVATSNPAAYGTVTTLQTNVFRAPGGVMLASQAFNQSPCETQFAGSSQSKHAMCLVRAMPFEASGVSGATTFGQPTYFLINQRARVAGRFLESLAIGGLLKAVNTSANTTTVPTSTLSKLNNLSRPLFLNGDDSLGDLSCLTIAVPAWSITNATLYSPIATLPGNVISTTQPATANYTPTAIVLQQSSANASIPAVQGGPYTVTSGAVTCIHDGAQSVEANYNFACPNLAAIALTSGTVLGGPTSGYYYVGVLEWYDEEGQLHRSTPSLPLCVYLYAASFYGATVYCPAIPTSKAGNVIFKLYRSIANRLNDGNYYLVGQVAASDGYFYGITDNTLLDASAVTVANPYPVTGTVNAFPRVYTGVSANSPNPVYASTPPPAFIWQTGNKGRHFGLAQIQGQFQLFYSSPTAAQLPPEWNSFNYCPVPFDIGDARSIDGMDDKVVIFGTRYNGVVAGDGPPTSNAAGVPNPGDGFGTITPIPTPAGVLGSGSPTRVPDGLVFQGFSGIQLLDRSLTIQPVGMPVDPITGRQTGNPGIIYGKGTTLPSIQSVVWPNASGAAMVYAYLTKKFSTWPLLSNAAMLVQTTDGNIYAAIQPIAGNSYAGVATSGTSGADLGILGSTYAPVFTPNANAPGLVLETPWILPHGVSGGECRVWNACLTGTWNGPHVLQIEQAYNYEAYSLLRVWDMSTAPRQYQIIAQPQSNTRMIAVRYRISLLPVTTLQAGYPMATLSDLVLFSASQQGTVRASAANRG